MKSMIKSHYFLAIIKIFLFLMLFTINCSIAPVAGGGSDTEVSGRITTTAGVNAAGIIVSLIDSTFDPAFGNQLSSTRIDTTDKSGAYHFDSVAQGIYNILAEHPDLHTKLLIKDIEVSSDKDVEIADSSLGKTANLEIQLPDSVAKQTGVVSIPGTTYFTNTTGLSNVVILESIPRGTISRIHFRNLPTTPIAIIYKNITIDTTAIIKINPYTAWQHTGKILLNTTSSGAYIDENVSEFPMILRLNSTNFNFSQTKKKGEDIRFVRPDNIALPFEIEKWDSSNGTAEIWIKVDTVYANSNSQHILMYWGNPSGKNSSQPNVVFDTANGFEGVWHLHQSGGTVQADATPNHFDATPVEMDGANDVAGIIGVAHDFDGSSQCLVVKDAQNSRLDVHKNSSYTVSAWVYPRNTLKAQDFIVSKGSAQYGLMVNELNRFTFYGGLFGLGVDTTTTAEMKINTWTYLAGVRIDNKQYLYINGILADSTSAAEQGYASIADNFYDLSIGRQSDDQSQWFDGMIDEVRVESKASSSTRINICFENQKQDQKFITFSTIK